MNEHAAINRRGLCAAMFAAGAVPASVLASPIHIDKAAGMKVTCFIRYEIDPFQREAFHTYARSWLTIIPRLGGDLIGYFLPYEGTNDVGWALISFSSLGEYEQYRARLRGDPEAMRNFAFAQDKRIILREERTFLANVTPEA